MSCGVFPQDTCAVGTEEGISVEKGDICKSLRSDGTRGRSDGTLHKTRKEAKFIGKEIR